MQRRLERDRPRLVRIGAADQHEQRALRVPRGAGLEQGRGAAAVDSLDTVTLSGEQQPRACTVALATRKLKRSRVVPAGSAFRCPGPDAARQQQRRYLRVAGMAGGQ